MRPDDPLADRTLEQLPDHIRHGEPVLVHADSAGATRGFLAHIRGLRGHGVNSFFSVGLAITEPIRTVITGRLAAGDRSRQEPARGGADRRDH